MSVKVPRVNVTFEDEIYGVLEAWSKKEYRSIASLVVYITAGHLLGQPPEVPSDIQKLMQEKTEEDNPLSSNNTSAVPPKELELTRRWVAGERLENEELRIVARLLGVEPEDLVRKQHKFVDKEEGEI